MPAAANRVEAHRLRLARTEKIENKEGDIAWRKHLLFYWTQMRSSCSSSTPSRPAPDREFLLEREKDRDDNQTTCSLTF
jgi:hypothetical protein